MSILSRLRGYGLVDPAAIEEYRKEMAENVIPAPDRKYRGLPESERAKKKTSHVGAPAIFALELACQHVNEAFGGRSFGHCYLVGSALERPDWRDIDIRLIMPDDEFFSLFPDAHNRCMWEHDPRWILLTTGISMYLSKASGLPVDFQFQPQTFANERHSKTRHAIGMRPPSVSGC